MGVMLFDSNPGCRNPLIAVLFFFSLFVSVHAMNPDTVFAAQSGGTDGNPDSNNIFEYLKLTPDDKSPVIEHGLLDVSGFTIAAGEYEAVLISEPVRLPDISFEPFVAVAASWQADRDITGFSDIDFRFSRDGTSWSEWVHAGQDPHATVEENLHHGNLVFSDRETRYLQFRLEIKRTPDGQSPRISRVRLHYINPGASDEALLQVLDEKSYHNRQLRRQTRPAKEERHLKELRGEIQDRQTFPLPDYVDRATWGASIGLTNRAGRTPTTVTHLVVHHSASNTTSSDFAAVVRGYYNFHVTGRGWVDIGYNWLVDGNGVVYQGRAFAMDGRKDVIGAHAGGFNTNSMGVCVIGNYMTIQPTDPARGALHEVLAWKADERGIDPQGKARHPATGRTLPTVQGHRDVTATSCPGNALYAQLSDIKLQVAVLIDSWFDKEDLVVEQSWERSFDAENAFEWMGSGSNETELSMDYHDGRLWVASSSEGSHIRILDADTGEETGLIDVAETASAWMPEGETFTIATVRVSDDGYLVVTNRTVDAGSDPFHVMVLKPDGSDVSGYLLFEEQGFGLGRQLSVKGSYSAGELSVYAPVSNQGKVLRWQGLAVQHADKHAAGQVRGKPMREVPLNADDSPVILELQGMSGWGGQADVALKISDKHPGFFAGSIQSDLIREFDAEGKQVGHVSFAEGSTRTSALRHASYAGREYLFAWHPNERKVRWQSLFGEPGDVDTDRTAVRLFLSEPLGSTSNRTTIRIGDLALRDYRNGSFDLFVLAPNNGIWSWYLQGPEYTGVVSARDELADLPESHELEQNYPNPFNPVTHITYTLPEASDVRLEIYNLLGQQVAVLVSSHQEAGRHTVHFDAGGLASGIYVYRLTAGNTIISRKMTLIK